MPCPSKHFLRRHAATLAVLALGATSFLVGRPATSAPGNSLPPAIEVAPGESISAAIDRASSGSTIVVHGGSYHESLTVPPGKRLQIVAAPGAEVWLDGSSPVRSWRRTADGWVHRGWDTEFDSSPTYTFGAPDNTEHGWSFVNDEHPMAAHPDQVWVAGTPQRQVASRSALRPGTFYVAERAERLYIGSDPEGRTVRASTLPRALAVRAAGTTVRGINVRRFAPSVPHMGAVTVEAAGVTLAGMTMRSNSTTALHVMQPDVVVRDVRLVRNGMLGMSATYADGLRLLRVTSRANNVEGFNYAPVAGGIKIGRTQGIRVIGARITDNAGTGLWFDESSRGIEVLDGALQDNLRHGLSLEISAGATVADTVIAGNAGDGVKVNNTSDVALWNNTIVDNGRPINIVQDDRDASDPDTPGHDPRQPVPAPGMTWINGPVEVHNNILGRGRPDANCLLCVEDYSGRFHAERFRIDSSGNVYARADRGSPTWVAVWSRGADDPAVFTSLEEFHRATGQEERRLGVLGRPAVTTSLRVTPEVRAEARRVAVGLSATVARWLGRAPGTRHLGAWLD